MSKSRRIVSAGLGVVVAAGGLALAYGNSNSGGAQLAVADRSAEATANRGGERSDVLPASVAAVGLADEGGVVDTTTTTVPPTTVAPTTTKAPTTRAPRATTTKAPKVAAAAKAPATPAKVREAAPSGAVADDVWKRLATCESGMRNDGGAPYYGYFQFLPSTWRSVGGTGMPNDHSYEVQKSFAMKLQARSGWGQWPACTRKLGIR